MSVLSLLQRFGLIPRERTLSAELKGGKKEIEQV